MFIYPKICLSTFVGLDALLQQTKKMTGILLASSLISCSSPTIPLRTQEPVAQKTLACSFFDWEETLGAAPQSHHSLHTIVATIQQKSPAENNNILNDPAQALLLIHNSIQEQGFVFGSYAGLFSDALQAKRLSAKELCLVYLAAGQKLGLPLRLGLAIHHPFIIWEGSQNLFWETTTGEHKDAQTYLQTMNIPPSALNTGVYLRPLEKKQEYAFVFAEKSRLHYQTGNIEQAFEDAGGSLALEPHLIAARTWRGRAAIQKKEYVTALNDARFLVQEYPDLPDGYILRARAYAAQGRTHAALHECNHILGIQTIIEEDGTKKVCAENKCQYPLLIDSESAETRRLRVQVLKLIGARERDLLSAIDYAIQLDPENAEGYFIQGTLREQSKTPEITSKAKESFETYYELRKKQGLEP